MTSIKNSIHACKIFFLGLAGLFLTGISLGQTTGTAITIGGKTIHTVGKLPALGTPVKDFTLTGVDLTDKTLADYKGKYVIMNIFTSVNKGVCSK